MSQNLDKMLTWLAILYFTSQYFCFQSSYIYFVVSSKSVKGVGSGTW